MFDVANCVACLNGGNGPGGTPSHEALSLSPQGALEISSVAGQPLSLDRSHCSTLMVAESLKHKRSRIESGLPGPSKLQGPVQEPNSASCKDNSTVIAYINK